MSDPFLAQVTMFAANFSPRGWAFCSGQLLSIAQNSALFSLLGTTYGGDGEVTFALPDLRGRTPRGHCGGTGPGLSPVPLGARGGVENRLLSVNQLPSHNHPLLNNANEQTADQTNPDGNVLAEPAAEIYSDQTATVRTSPTNTGQQGGGQAFNILNPYLGLNFIIALVGTFPSPN